MCFKCLLFAQESQLNGLFVRPSIEDAKGNAIMNFNPALNFGSGKTPIAYSNVLSKSYTLFYVYKEKKVIDSVSMDKREYPFLELHFNGRIYNATSSFFSGDKKFFIQADHRFNGTLVNHYGSFSPSKVGSKMHANLLFLFDRPHIELYEVAVFPSFLAVEDYAKVYSYLGIKYSIPLPINFNYVDSEGHVIWNAKENKEYSNRIIGLGRADKFELKQYQSAAYNDRLLTVGFDDQIHMYANRSNVKDFQDNSYVLLGDNNGALTFEKKKGQEQLERKWKIVNRNANTALHVFFNRNDIEQSKETAEQQELTYTYQLSVSAKDNGSLATLIPMELKNDSLLYGVIPMNTDQKYVSIVRKQKVDFDFMFQVKCDVVDFKVNLLHGKLPYSIKIETEDGVRTLNSTQQSIDFNLSISEVGKMEFVLEDALGNKKKKVVDILDALVPPVSVSSTYFLVPNGTVEISPNLNAGAVENASYKWYDQKSNLLSTDPVLTLKEVGTYTLEVSSGIHTYCTHFKVQLNSSEKEVHPTGVYPNPVNKLEEFVVYIPLEQKQDAEVLVYTNKGQLLDYRMYRTTDRVLYKSTIATTGMYIVVVKTGEQKQFYRLMVK